MQERIVLDWSKPMLQKKPPPASTSITRSKIIYLLQWREIVSMTSKYWLIYHQNSRNSTGIPQRKEKKLLKRETSIHKEENKRRNKWI